MPEDETEQQRMVQIATNMAGRGTDIKLEPQLWRPLSEVKKG